MWQTRGSPTSVSSRASVAGTVPPVEERIIELEVKTAYQDKVIADLDEVLRTFTARVEELSRELAELKESVRAEQSTIGPANEKPPHY